MAKRTLAKQSDVIKQYMASRGNPPSEGVQKFAECDPAYFEKWMAVSSHPRETGHLTPKMRELIILAMDSQVTHMYAPGMRTHIRNALNMGITREEIMEVLQLISVLGFHSYMVAAPILLEEYKEFSAKKKGRSKKLRR